jgi:F-type H+-transporting ATPase subunit epsilon
MFHLDIVTPYRQFFSEEVEMVIVRGLEGDLAILSGKSPITTPLRIGKIRIFQEGVERIAAVVDGYISVIDDKTTIVTEAAEWPDEIDIERAKKAKERAENRMRQEKQTTDIDRAELALKRALNRLEISNRNK